MTDKSYSSHLEEITKEIRQEAEKNRLEAAQQVRQELLKKEPGLAMQDGAVPVSITVDDTKGDFPQSMAW